MTRGGLVYVMGPSGAGKDSLIGHARSHGPAGWPVAFAHRYITRPASADGENHVALSAREFDLRDRLGLFAFTWRAHGERYGIGREIELWRQAGLTVVVSGSRAHFGDVRAACAGVVPVLVTARSETLAARLAGRGREGAAAIVARLRRSAEVADPPPDARVIENDGTLAEAGSRLIGVIEEAARVGAAEGTND